MLHPPRDIRAHSGLVNQPTVPEGSANTVRGCGQHHEVAVVLTDVAVQDVFSRTYAGLHDAACLLDHGFQAQHNLLYRQVDDVGIFTASKYCPCHNRRCTRHPVPLIATGVEHSLQTQPDLDHHVLGGLPVLCQPASE